MGTTPPANNIAINESYTPFSSAPMPCLTNTAGSRSSSATPCSTCRDGELHELEPRSGKVISDLFAEKSLVVANDSFQYNLHFEFFAYIKSNEETDINLYVASVSRNDSKTPRLAYCFCEHLKLTLSNNSPFPVAYADRIKPTVPMESMIRERSSECWG
ncbi:hypothetical protein CBL_13189 [Carabus blaptoides fortunei]